MNAQKRIMSKMFLSHGNKVLTMIQIFSEIQLLCKIDTIIFYFLNKSNDFGGKIVN